MDPTRFQIITPSTDNDYRKLVGPLAEACWPEFMLHDPIADEYWSALFERFSDYQFGMFDTQSHQIAAMGNSVPLQWNDHLDNLPEEGWDWGFEEAIYGHKRGRDPNIQCAIQIAIHPEYQRRGLSKAMVRAMRNIGKSKGFQSLIAPVRPNQKSLYPLTDMDRYLIWKTDDGRPFDAWLRVHKEFGAEIIKVCHRSMLISGSRRDWEILDEPSISRIWTIYRCRRA